MSESTLTPFDAIHMVVYGVENTPDGPRPNENFMREGFYQVRAAVASLKDGQSNNVVIGGINYGTLDGSVRISQVYADNLRQNFLAEDIEGVNVFAEAEQLSPDQIESGAKETGGEVDFVLAQARLRGWRKILCISDDIHEKRVRMLYRSRGGTSFRRL